MKFFSTVIFFLKKISNGHFSEGFVVCDANFNRLKVKAPQYVALACKKLAFLFLSWKKKLIIARSPMSDMSERNHRRDVNVRQMLQIVRINESSEFLTYKKREKVTKLGNLQFFLTFLLL